MSGEEAQRSPGLVSGRYSQFLDVISDYGAVEDAQEVLYVASFDELSSNLVRYDIVMWLSISLLLVFAWGVGIILLLYLPYKRYVLRKDIASRKLIVTPSELVYTVTRPSYVPFCGEAKVEKHLQLSLIIDIIIEQGCLQAVYGLHTFRVESIAQGNAAAAVDEFHILGVSNPGYLRKVLISNAAKAILDTRTNWNANITGGESIHSLESLTLGPAVLMSPVQSKERKRKGISHHQQRMEARGMAASTDLLLNKLEEVSSSVKKIELIIDKNPIPTMPSLVLENQTE